MNADRPEPPQPDGTGLERHEGLIRHVLRRHGYLAVRGSLEEDDLLQAGRIGLARAAVEWDPQRGAFSTVASLWIRQHVGRLVANERGTVRVPVYEQQRRRRAGERMTPATRSINAPVRGRKGEGETPMLELLEDEAQAEKAERAEDQAHAAAIVGELLEEADDLSARERLVIRCRFQGEATLQTIGDALGVSREMVRVIEAKALQKLSAAAARLRLTAADAA